MLCCQRHHSGSSHSSVLEQDGTPDSSAKGGIRPSMGSGGFAVESDLPWVQGGMSCGIRPSMGSGGFIKSPLPIGKKQHKKKLKNTATAGVWGQGHGEGRGGGQGTGGQGRGGSPGWHRAVTSAPRPRAVTSAPPQPAQHCCFLGWVCVRKPPLPPTEVFGNQGKTTKRGRGKEAAAVGAPTPSACGNTNGPRWGRSAALPDAADGTAPSPAETRTR